MANPTTTPAIAVYSNLAPDSFVRGFQRLDPLRLGLTISALPDRFQGGEAAAVCDWIFRVLNIDAGLLIGTQEISCADAWRGLRLPSLSVGDVVVVNGAAYACDGIGWTMVNLDGCEVVTFQEPKPRFLMDLNIKRHEAYWEPVDSNVREALDNRMAYAHYHAWDTLQRGFSRAHAFWLGVESGIRAGQQLLQARSTCDTKMCSYYSHYRPQDEKYAHRGHPIFLPHDSFHVAEKECERAQVAVEGWMDSNPTGEPPARLIEQTEYWERVVRA